MSNPIYDMMKQMETQKDIAEISAILSGYENANGRNRALDIHDMVNTRREFFRVSLDEIKAVVKQNFDQTVDFVDVPLAEQYRQSELMRK